ncbi:OmpH family outer membrane protein [Pedobacter frigiditerrae]|uniref:OmpH family outer membrane protein n=1 Tax=Pedobacter frigiditerrae TaxID=2530452 RepID=UPI002931B766|nr:OmpH family outer membrane protein [Pedobacter frigiditerrae]
MRKLINVFFVAAGLLLTANVASAQQKLGHINSEEIYATFPEALTAQNALQTFAKGKQAEIDKMIAEYQTKAKAAQDKEQKGQKLQNEMSEANKEATLKELNIISKELQDAGVELQTIQKKVEDARTKASTDVQTKQVELFTPVNTKVANGMSAVAKEKGLAYVFDIANGQGANNLVYFDGGEDITAAVKTKLGIAATAAPVTKAPATTPAKKN